MINPFETVKDSSIWHSSSNFTAVESKDPYIRIGIVKKVYRDKTTTDLRYLVEIRDKNDQIELNCRAMRKFGGAYNYEDVVYRGYKIDDKPDPVQAMDAKAGDMVVVAHLNGEAREGIIIGGLAHTARTSTVDITKGPQYKSEFNGIETVINESGEYTVTFKAIPTNAKKLEDKPSKKIAAPTYDTKIGTSFFKFDKTGSYEVGDNSTTGKQSIKIDKANGIVHVNSGKITLTMTKKEEKVELKCKILNIVSDDKITGKTKEYSMDASTSVKIKSPKVAIGKDGVELLDQLSQLVDALGKVIPISPVGPCSAIAASPQWNGVVSVQSKIKSITGGL